MHLSLLLSLLLLSTTAVQANPNVPPTKGQPGWTPEVQLCYDSSRVVSLACSRWQVSKCEGHDSPALIWWYEALPPDPNDHCWGLAYDCQQALLGCVGHPDQR